MRWLVFLFLLGTSRGRMSPLYGTLYDGHVETVKELLKQPRMDVEEGFHLRMEEALEGTYSGIVMENVRGVHIPVLNKNTKQKIPSLVRLTEWEIHLSPLIGACLVGEREIMEVLLDAGANPLATAGVTMWGVPTNKWNEALHGSKPKGAQVLTGHSVFEPLTAAAIGGYTELARVLFPLLGFRAGEEMDRSKATTELIIHALLTATMSKQRDFIKVVLELSGPDAGKTPLFQSAQLGMVDMVQLYIEAGVDPNQGAGQGTDGMLPLHAASENGHTDVVEFLVREGGAQVNRESAEGATALHYAVLGNSEDVVALLLKVPGIRNVKVGDDEVTALKMAEEMDAEEIVELLVEANLPEVEGLPEDGGNLSKRNQVLRLRRTSFFAGEDEAYEENGGILTLGEEKGKLEPDANWYL